MGIQSGKTRTTNNFKLGKFLGDGIKKATQKKTVKIFNDGFAEARNGNPNKHSRKGAILYSYTLLMMDSDSDARENYQKLCRGETDVLNSVGWDETTGKLGDTTSVNEATNLMTQKIKVIAASGEAPYPESERYLLWILADDMAFHLSEAAKLAPGNMGEKMKADAEPYIIATRVLKDSLGEAAVDDYRELHPYSTGKSNS